MEHITNPQRLREIALADLGPMDKGDFFSFKKLSITIANQHGIDMLQTWIVIGNAVIVSNIDTGVNKTPIEEWWKQMLSVFSEDIPHVYVINLLEYNVAPIVA